MYADPLLRKEGIAIRIGVSNPVLRVLHLCGDCRCLWHVHHTRCALMLAAIVSGNGYCCQEEEHYESEVCHAICMPFEIVTVVFVCWSCDRLLTGCVELSVKYY